MGRSIAHAPARILQAAVVALSCAGCYSGVITVRLRNEAPSGIYLRQGVFTEFYYASSSDKEFLDPGGTRDIGISYRDGKIEASFTVHDELIEGTQTRYGLALIGSCISRLDEEVLRDSRPEVVWTGSQLQCRGWF